MKSGDYKNISFTSLHFVSKGTLCWVFCVAIANCRQSLHLNCLLSFTKFRTLKPQLEVDLYNFSFCSSFQLQQADRGQFENASGPISPPINCSYWKESLPKLNTYHVKDRSNWPTVWNWRNVKSMFGFKIAAVNTKSASNCLRARSIKEMWHQWPMISIIYWFKNVIMMVPPPNEMQFIIGCYWIRLQSYQQDRNWLIVKFEFFSDKEFCFFKLFVCVFYLNDCAFIVCSVTEHSHGSHP